MKGNKFDMLGEVTGENNLKSFNTTEKSDDVSSSSSKHAKDKENYKHLAVNSPDK